MSAVSNPLVGASFGTNPINPALFSNPSGTNPGAPPSTNPFSAPAPLPTANTGPLGNPGNLEDPASNLKDATRNAGFENVITGQYRNTLIPQFANELFSLATPAANYFANLMNLGSPYYQQQQRASFEQGVGQNQNASAQAQQQINRQGYGYTPSGASAATIGGMNIAGGQNLAQLFLQNLFQNENLQSQAGSALAQLASLFNPSQLTGQSTQVGGSTQGPSAAGQIGSILGGIGSLFAPSGGIPGLGHS